MSLTTAHDDGQSFGRRIRLSLGTMGGVEGIASRCSSCLTLPATLSTRFRQGRIARRVEEHFFCISLDPPSSRLPRGFKGARHRLDGWHFRLMGQSPEASALLHWPSHVQCRPNTPLHSLRVHRMTLILDVCQSTTRGPLDWIGCKSRTSSANLPRPARTLHRPPSHRQRPMLHLHGKISTCSIPTYPTERLNAPPDAAATLSPQSRTASNVAAPTAPRARTRATTTTTGPPHSSRTTRVSAAAERASTARPCPVVWHRHLCIRSAAVRAATKPATHVRSAPRHCRGGARQAGRRWRPAW